MKRIILVVALVLAASIAVAVPYHSNITKGTMTKAGSITMPVSGSVLYQTGSGTCRMFINASSATSVPLAASTRYEANLPVNVTNLVFKCTSSTRAANSIYVIQ